MVGASEEICGGTVASVTAEDCEDDSGTLDVATTSCWGACELACDTSFTCGSVVVVVCGCCEATSAALLVSVGIVCTAKSALDMLDEVSGLAVVGIVGSLVARGEPLVGASTGVEPTVEGSGDELSLFDVVVASDGLEVLITGLVSALGSAGRVVIEA